MAEMLYAYPCASCPGGQVAYCVDWSDGTTSGGQCPAGGAPQPFGVGRAAGWRFLTPAEHRAARGIEQGARNAWTPRRRKQRLAELNRLRKAGAQGYGVGQGEIEEIVVTGTRIPRRRSALATRGLVCTRCEGGKRLCCSMELGHCYTFQCQSR